MALGAGHHVVDEDTDLVAEAFVVLFVTSSENHLKGGFQRRDHLGVDRQLADGLCATDFNKIP